MKSSTGSEEKTPLLNVPAKKNKLIQCSGDPQACFRGLKQLAPRLFLPKQAYAPSKVDDNPKQSIEDFISGSDSNSDNDNDDGSANSSYLMEPAYLQGESLKKLTMSNFFDNISPNLSIAGSGSAPSSQGSEDSFTTIPLQDNAEVQDHPLSIREQEKLKRFFTQTFTSVTGLISKTYYTAGMGFALSAILNESIAQSTTALGIEGKCIITGVCVGMVWLTTVFAYRTINNSVVKKYAKGDRRTLFQITKKHLWYLLGSMLSGLAVALPFYFSARVCHELLNDLSQTIAEKVVTAMVQGGKFIFMGQAAAHLITSFFTIVGRVVFEKTPALFNNFQPRNLSDRIHFLMRSAANILANGVVPLGVYLAASGGQAAAQYAMTQFNSGSEWDNIGEESASYILYGLIYALVLSGGVALTNGLLSFFTALWFIVDEWFSNRRGDYFQYYEVESAGTISINYMDGQAQNSSDEKA